MKTKRTIINIMIVICLAIFGFSAYQVMNYQKQQRQMEQEDEELDDIIASTLQTEDLEEDDAMEEIFNASTFQQFKKVNQDFTCYMAWDSEIIKLPVVQYVNNDYYLNYSFKKKWSSQGTVFMDYRSNWKDDNVTLYGHYVYNQPKRMFSPLQRLKTQTGYENNKTMTLYFQNKKVVYHVLYVYEFDVNKDGNYDFTKRNFTSEAQFNQFATYADKKSTIISEQQAQYGDHLLTLQTCVKNKEDKRLVVVLKLMEEIPYETASGE